MSVFYCEVSAPSECQDGENNGVSPEEVYTSMRVAGDSRTLPCKWLQAELPVLLDQIRMLAAASSLQSGTEQTVSTLTHTPDQSHVGSTVTSALNWLYCNTEQATRRAC